MVRGALADKAVQQSSAVSPQALFTSMRDGMQRMVESIVRQVPRETLRSSRRVEAIKAQENGWQIKAGETTEDFDHLILAVPAHVSAKLIAELPGSERPAELLGEISYSSAVTVALVVAGVILLATGIGFRDPH